MPDYEKKSFLILDSTFGGDDTRNGNSSEYFTPRGIDTAVADFNWSAILNQASFASGNPFAFFWYFELFENTRFSKVLVL